MSLHLHVWRVPMLDEKLSLWAQPIDPLQPINLFCFSRRPPSGKLRSLRIHHSEQLMMQPPLVMYWTGKTIEILAELLETYGVESGGDLFEIRFKHQELPLAMAVHDPVTMATCGIGESLVIELAGAPIGMHFGLLSQVRAPLEGPG